MKKIIMSAIVSIMAVGGAHADFQQVTAPAGAPNEGGFIAHPQTISTVQHVKELADDTNVVMQGRIVKRIDNDGKYSFKDSNSPKRKDKDDGNKYMFEDETGTITVEIDSKDWPDQTITSSDTVKIYGEVDRGMFTTEIEVDRVEKM